MEGISVLIKNDIGKEDKYHINFDLLSKAGIKDNIKHPLEITKETIYIKGNKSIEISCFIIYFLMKILINIWIPTE